MLKALLLIVLAFSVGLVHSLPVDNIVIGVFTQKYHYGDHQALYGASLTYLAPTYVNIASMTGAKVVPIFSYSSKEQILSQLNKVNGIIFTGGEEYININTTWTKNALTVIEYAKQENDAGKTFPVLGICQGLELMLYLTSNMRADFLDSIYDQNGVWNTLQIVKRDFYLLDGISDQTYQAITDPKKTPQGGPMYFYHSNGTLLSTFQKDKDLSAFWNLIATTSKGNQTFVTYLQAKNYPFYITQFHPERLSFSANLSDQLFYARGELVTTIALNFAMKCKQNPHRYSRDQLNTDIIENYPLFTSTRFSDYKVYLFNEWGQGSLRKEDTSDGTFAQIISWFSAAFFVVLLIGGGYFLFRKKKQNQNDFTDNNEVLSPSQR